MTNLERGLLIGACVVGILAGSLFFYKSIAVDCVKLPLIGTACAAVVN